VFELVVLMWGCMAVMFELRMVVVVVVVEMVVMVVVAIEFLEMKCLSVF
jgi:hypothetical protein